MKRPFKDRFWLFDRKGWTPRWWNQLGVPQINNTGDEWGYRCIIWGTRLTGYVVFAWYRCPCWDCEGCRMVMEVREIYGDDVAEDLDNYLDRIRLREVPGAGPLRPGKHAL